jgi:hypothetical protein
VTDLLFHTCRHYPWHQPDHFAFVPLQDSENVTMSKLEPFIKMLLYNGRGITVESQSTLS